jgi:hypothetical protein
MGTILATVAGLVIWIVLWSLDIKAIDGIMITMVIVLTALMGRMVAPYLPGSRD